jgi:hypothetical protein
MAGAIGHVSFLAGPLRLEPIDERGPLPLEERVHVVEILEPLACLERPVGDQLEPSLRHLAAGRDERQAGAKETGGHPCGNREVLAAISRSGSAANRAGWLEQACHATDRAAAGVQPLGDLRRRAFRGVADEEPSQNPSGHPRQAGTDGRGHRLDELVFRHVRGY